MEPPSFEEFAQGRLRNAWVQESKLKLYMRRALDFLHPGIDFVLANLEGDSPGSGALTRFLDRYEPRYRFRFELVQNPRLVRYLSRRGYVVASRPWEEGQAPMMQKPAGESSNARRAGY